MQLLNLFTLVANEYIYYARRELYVALYIAGVTKQSEHVIVLKNVAEYT